MKKPKCKPASTLKSVSGLGLSKRAERYVEKNYFSMDQLVWHVRFLYYMMQYHPETLKAYRPKVFTEIISALNTAGYIRTDFVADSFGFKYLVRVLFGNKCEPVILECFLPEFCKKSNRFRLTNRPDDQSCLEWNKIYENDALLYKKTLKTFRSNLRSYLSAAEMKYFDYRFGFNKHRTHTLSQTAAEFKLTIPEAKKQEKEILKKIELSKIIYTI